MTTGVFIFAVFLGGITGTPESWGFWKSFFWPYYVTQMAVRRFLAEEP